MLDTLRTPRLLLRSWRDSDRFPFRQMNADARVMEFFPELLTSEASDALFDCAQEHFKQHGYGPFAIELIETGTFIGFAGLSIPAFEHWGKGLATEGARAALNFAFNDLGLEKVVSFTVPANLRSRRVMEKLGMTHDPCDDFDHPQLPDGHPLRRHVLFRISR